LKSNPDSASRSAGKAALIFEFDHLVARLREATFEILKSIFDEHDIQPIHISRFALASTPAKLIEQMQLMIGVKKGPVKKLTEELVNGLQMHLETGNIQVTDALRDVIVQARGRGMPVYGLTSLPAGPRDILGDRLDLSGLGIEYMPFGTGFEPYPKADAWLKLIKEHGVLGPVSLAATTSMSATKAAMTAGVHCVVVTDRFTEFQDFGGAQSVVSGPKEIVLADLLPPRS